MKSTFMIQKVDFKTYQLDQPVKLVMNLKEFKTMVDYMDTMETTVTLEFTEPGRYDEQNRKRAIGLKK